MLPMFPLCRPSVRFEQIGDEVIVHDEARDYVHVFGSRARQVLNLCDGLHSCDEIVESLRVGTGQTYADAAGEVAHIVGTFADLALVVSTALGEPRLIA